MSFGAPQYLGWMLMPVFLFILLRWDLKRQESSIAGMIHPRLWTRIIPDWVPQARLKKATVFCASLFFIFLALARPQWGEREEVVHSSGIDVMLVLDVSRSMDVEDVAPSRLKKARHWIRSFLGRVPGSRVGVVAFASSTYVSCPLTTDLDYVGESIEILEPSMISNQGTDIGLALQTALQAIERGAENSDTEEAEKIVSKAIILISDGEDHEGAFEEAAEKIRKRGVRLLVLGVGTSRGGPIPLRDETGRLVGYKRSGNEQVQSQFKSDSLEKVASVAGGKYWNISQSESEIDAVLSDLGALESTTEKEQLVRVPIERFQWPLGIAVFLLILELSIPLMSRIKGITRLIKIASLIFISISLSSPRAEASQVQSYMKNREGLADFESNKTEDAEKSFIDAHNADPEKTEPRFNLGVVQMKKGDAKSAIQSFESAARNAGISGNSSLLAQSLYNLGSAYEKSGQDADALKSFANAVRMAELSKNEPLAIEARKRIQKLQEQNKNKQQKPQGGGGSSNEQKRDEGEPNEPKNQDKKGGEQPPQFEDPSVSRRRQFKSEKLSPEDSERVMNELSSREKQLQTKLKKQRGTRNTTNGRDW
ncbi:MAG: VWA domain-containing protein [Bdellovibrionales bacterium]|nr:VWA domain-containing protein [Bdellovibrionales bacterium]